jgi:hypothetical protein
MNMQAGRRDFLKLASGLTALAIASPLYWYAEQRWSEWSPSPLTADAKTIWCKIATVILSGVLPVAASVSESALAQWWLRFQQTVNVLPITTQRELGQLVLSLEFAPTRRTVWGVSAAWSEATADEIRDFLEGCRYSSVPDIQSAYHAIHDLTLAAWYSDEAHWADIDYAPPPYLFS